jgi:hypothetical protein
LQDGQTRCRRNRCDDENVNRVSEFGSGPNGVVAIPDDSLSRYLNRRQTLASCLSQAALRIQPQLNQIATAWKEETGIYRLLNLTGWHHNRILPTSRQTHERFLHHTSALAS